MVTDDTDTVTPRLVWIAVARAELDSPEAMLLSATTSGYRSRISTTTVLESDQVSKMASSERPEMWHVSSAIRTLSDTALPDEDKSDKRQEQNKIEEAGPTS